MVMSDTRSASVAAAAILLVSATAAQSVFPAGPTAGHVTIRAEIDGGLEFCGPGLYSRRVTATTPVPSLGVSNTVGGGETIIFPACPTFQVATATAQGSVSASALLVNGEIRTVGVNVGSVVTVSGANGTSPLSGTKMLAETSGWISIRITDFTRPSTDLFFAASATSLTPPIGCAETAVVENSSNTLLLIPELGPCATPAACNALLGTWRGVMYPGTYTFVGRSTFRALGEDTGCLSTRIGGSTNLIFRVNGTPTTPPPCSGTGPCADVNLDGSFTIEDLFAWRQAPFDSDGDGQIDPESCGQDAAFLANMLVAMDPTTDADNTGVPDNYEDAIGGPCARVTRSDLNADSSRDSFDAAEYLNRFAAADPAAEVTGDSPAELTRLDIDTFLAILAAGL
ncbi:MAG: hypothetical protein AAGI30_07770 [Planctomycetota bacterium]